MIENCVEAALHLIIRKQHNIKSSVHVNYVKLEQVEQMKYVGCRLKHNADAEIRCRAEQARMTSRKMNKVLYSRDIQLSVRIRLLRFCVISVLLYGVEDKQDSKL